MVALALLSLNLVAALFKSKSRLEAENAALRQQLIVLRRKVRGRVQLTGGDRLFFVQLYRWFPSILKVITIVRPETLVRWHREGFPGTLALLEAGRHRFGLGGVIQCTISLWGRRNRLPPLLGSQLKAPLYANIQAPYPTTRSREPAVSPELHNDSRLALRPRRSASNSKPATGRQPQAWFGPRLAWSPRSMAAAVAKSRRRAAS